VSLLACSFWSVPSCPWTKTGASLRLGGLLLAGICASVCVGCAGSTSESHAAPAPIPSIAPSIATEPANQTVIEGQSATFSVTASGTPPPTYQWQKNGANISGANAASYATPATVSVDNGSTFDVIVSNSMGSVTSTSAKLTVDTASSPPSITNQPTNQTVIAGQSATFFVTASGTPPLTYRWQKNGADISGANGASYATPATATADSGSIFDVIVTNAAGAVTSNTATLTVNATISRIDFGSGFTPSGLSLNGSATINGSRLRLTDGGANEAGSAFFDTPVNVQSFITDFDFQLTNADADGFTFVLQGGSPTALGQTGQSLGFGGGSGSSGIANSVAIGFQLYTGGAVSLAGMWTNGASPGATPGTDTTSSGINLHSDDLMNAHVTYDGTILALIITDRVTKASFGISFPVDIPSLIGGDGAYVGFTGGTESVTGTQDIVNWTYSAIAVAPFAWPVDAPVTYAASACGGANDYATYCSQSPIFGQYHTGIDVCPQTPGCAIGNPVYATSNGIVELALVVNSSAFLCDGSAATGYQINPSTSNLGNVIVIAHPNGKFSLYGHLDCIWPGIVPGVQVATGTRIGNQGHSADGDQDRTFTPHTHFEIKDRAVTGDPTNKGYSGYTTDLPDGYGYQDARVYLAPFVSTTVAPTAVQVVAASAQSVRTGPDSSFAFLTSIAPAQEFVATAVNGSWYRIDLPNVNGPVSGWAQASSGAQTLLVVDSNAAQIQVVGASSSGLDISVGASSSPDLVSWDQTFLDCVPVAKIWNGQRFVTIGNQNGFDEFYLPLNYHFNSSNACSEPSAPGPSTGWVSSSFLQ